jgi:hypothetical protein
MSLALDRPVGSYCQLRLTKVVRGVLHVTVRWAPAAIASQPGPYAFRIAQSGRWSDGWTCNHARDVVVRPRVHGSWDDWRASPIIENREGS